MTARHDPPGKILGDHGAGDIKYAARVESTVMSRKGDRRSGERACLRRTVCQVDLSLSLSFAASLFAHWIYIAILAIRNLYVILEIAEYNLLDVIGNCAVIHFVIVVRYEDKS